MMYLFLCKMEKVRLMDIKSDPTFANDTTELLLAAAIRDRFWGQNVTYKVFVCICGNKIDPEPKYPRSKIDHEKW